MVFLAASVGFDVIQEEMPAVNFVHKYENVFAFKCVFQLARTPRVS